jgi:hypothetical protein
MAGDRDKTCSGADTLSIDAQTARTTPPRSKGRDNSIDPLALPTLTLLIPPKNPHKRVRPRPRSPPRPCIAIKVSDIEEANIIKMVLPRIQLVMSLLKSVINKFEMVQQYLIKYSRFISWDRPNTFELPFREFDFWPKPI